MKPAGDERTPDGSEQLPGPATGEQLLDVRSTDHDDALVLEVSGELDGLTAPRLRAVLRNAFARLDGRVLVLDLTKVWFLGSPGLRALLDGAKEAGGQPGRLPLRVVVDRNRPVLRPIEMTGMDNVLALFYDVDEALAG